MKDAKRTCHLPTHRCQSVFEKIREMVVMGRQNTSTHGIVRACVRACVCACAHACVRIPSNILHNVEPVCLSVSFLFLFLT